MITNPYKEDRKPSKGEIEVEQGSLLLILFRWLKVPMPHASDPTKVERVGQLLQRKYPWLTKIAGAWRKKK